MLNISYAGENFYALLDIDKSATTKDIRKAFKKIALKSHPDKNMVSCKCFISVVHQIYF